MPTQEDFQELIDETDNEWTSINGVYGYKFTSKAHSSKYIFLPAAGYCYDSNLSNVGKGADYWSSDIRTGGPDDAWYLYFNDRGIDTDYDDRYYGYTVRPVQNS